jgi:catechol 2,3-dioxygenase-like lactoylglutathione lyase family enzyme
VITLGVSNLDAALEFYRDGLGLDSPGIIGTEFPGDETSPAGAAAMFQLEDGLILTIYPRSELAKDANIPLGPPNTGEFSIGHAVASKAEVDALLARANEAGATVTALGRDRPWGSTQATSAISTGICGRSCGTLGSTSESRAQRRDAREPPTTSTGTLRRVCGVKGARRRRGLTAPFGLTRARY